VQSTSIGHEEGADNSASVVNDESTENKTTKYSDKAQVGECQGKKR
jgi:hypothetical protein